MEKAKLSLQDVKNPVVTLKQQKMLLEVYKGNSLKLKMLQKLINANLLYCNDKQEYKLTERGMIALDYLLQKREKVNAANEKKRERSRRIARKSRQKADT